jgi:hypothetical protein
VTTAGPGGPLRLVEKPVAASPAAAADIPQIDPERADDYTGITAADTVSGRA